MKLILLTLSLICALPVQAASARPPKIGTVNVAREDALDIRDYGAVIDGITDDSAAVQATITAAIAAHKSVKIPGGTNRWDSPIYATSPITIRGAGMESTIVMGYGTGSLLTLGSTNLSGIYVPYTITGIQFAMGASTMTNIINVRQGVVNTYINYCYFNAALSLTNSSYIYGGGNNWYMEVSFNKFDPVHLSPGGIFVVMDAPSPVNNGNQLFFHHNQQQGNGLGTDWMMILTGQGHRIHDNVLAARVKGIWLKGDNSANSYNHSTYIGPNNYFESQAPSGGGVIQWSGDQYALTIFDSYFNCKNGDNQFSLPSMPNGNVLSPINSSTTNTLRGAVFSGNKIYHQTNGYPITLNVADTNLFASQNFYSDVLSTTGLIELTAIDNLNSFKTTKAFYYGTNYPSSGTYKKGDILLSTSLTTAGLVTNTIYTSDFSATANNFAAVSGVSAADGNIDSILTTNDTLRITSSSSTGGHIAGRNTTFTIGAYTNEVTLSIYIPSGNTSVKKLIVGAGLTSGTGAALCAATAGAWTRETVTIVSALSDKLYLAMADNSGNASFTGTSGDVIYVKDIVIGQRSPTAATLSGTLGWVCVLAGTPGTWAKLSIGHAPDQMTKSTRNAISSPDDGLLIYQTDSTPGIRFRENGAWVRPTVTADP